MQSITVLGSTGSIGQSTLDIVRQHRDQYRVFALVANKNIEQMLSDVLEFRPDFCVLANSDSALELTQMLKQSGCTTEVLVGMANIELVSSHAEVDLVMAAIVGAAGLLPALAAVKAGKKVLLANKEALVMSGQFFIDAARQHNATILPVDSEHNAIFQCLSHRCQTEIGYSDLEHAGVHKILLTGSGGPFRKTPVEQLVSMTPAQAIAHPNWSMGRKISVDSATMMNKGLEFIEAKWLFNASPAQIEVIIHPQSVVHSMVQYKDGSVIAQLGQPDMRTPIAFSMAYPQRISSGVPPLNFSQLSGLDFWVPDFERYPCLKLAIDACWEGQTMTTALNAANEIAVEAFLNERVKFTDIYHTVADTLIQINAVSVSSLEDILEIDQEARNIATQIVKRIAA